MVVKSLVDTKIIIFSNNYIDKKYKNNILKFKNIINIWINKYIRK